MLQSKHHQLPKDTQVGFSSSSIITSMVIPVAQSDDNYHWNVTLKFQNREISLPFFYYQVKPTTRDIVERLSYEMSLFVKCQTIHEWAKEVGCDPEAPNIQKVFNESSEEIQKMKYLLGEKYFFLFINDIDKFACVMVESVR